MRIQRKVRQTMAVTVLTLSLTAAPAVALAATGSSAPAWAKMPVRAVAADNGTTGGAAVPGPNYLGGAPIVPKPIDPQVAQEIANDGVAALPSKFRADGSVRALVRSAQPGALKPAATVPDPLDFGNQPEDPVDYRLPQAAGRFQVGSTYQISRPLPGGTAAGTVPAGLGDFYGQKLNWGACEPFGYDSVDDAGNSFDCAYLIVPVDYSQPNGATAAIGMMRLKAAGTSQGSLFMDPGGPGGSGMDMASWMAPEMTKLHEKFDLIGFDPRGVGSSLPQIRCKSAAAFDAQREGSDGLNGEQLDQILKHNTDSCYNNTGKLFSGFDSEKYLANIGTRNVVKDLDLARSVVGDAKLTYAGFSYGTSIGYQYAMAFQDNIRALVLDGVVNPFENAPETMKKYQKYLTDDPGNLDIAQIAGFQATFEQFLKQCSADGGFNIRTMNNGQPVETFVPCALGAKGSDPKVMLKNYQALSQAAWGGNTYVNSADNRPVSFLDLNMGTIQALYSSRYWPLLNVAYTQLRDEKDGRTIQRLADAYYDRDSQTKKYGFGDDAFTTISCTDALADDGNRQDNADMNRRAIEAAPFTDPGKDPVTGKQRGVEPSYSWCHYYRHKGDLPEGKEVPGSPNVLVISTTYDSATPFPNGVVAADAINGTLLTVEGTSHTSYGRVECATDIGDDYLLNVKVPADGATSGQVSKSKDLYSKVIDAKECAITHFRKVNTDQPKVNSGQKVIATAQGYIPGQAVQFQLHSDPVALGEAIANNEGIATLSFVAPNLGGDHQVHAVQKSGINTLDTATPLHIVAAASPGEPVPGSGTGTNPGAVTPGGSQSGKGSGNPLLAATGADSITLALVALMLVAFGVGVQSRRRYC